MADQGDSDPIPLMRQLAEMANMPLALCRRIVLVIYVEDVPRMFIETFLNQDKTKVQLQRTEMVVSDAPINVDTTTMQNDTYRTHKQVH